MRNAYKHKMVHHACTTNFHSGWIVNFLCREEATTAKWEGAKSEQKIFIENPKKNKSFYASTVLNVLPTF